MLRRWPVALVTLLFLAPGALPDEENVPPEQVAGWKVYTDVPRLMRIPITDIPGRALRPNPGAAVELALSTHGNVVPFWVNARRDTLVFWGEHCQRFTDQRGECFHLQPTPEGHGQLSLDAQVIAADVKEESTTTEGVRSLVPSEKRAYNPIEGLDLKSLSKGQRDGGYWFHSKTLTFTSNIETTATLELSGVYVTRMHRTPLPGGRYLEQQGLHSSQKLGKLHMKVGEKEVEADLRKQGDDVSVQIPITVGKNVIELSAR